MTGNDSGTGVAGSSYTHYDYPGIYEYQDFHHCGLEPNDLLVDFFSAAEVQTCELVGLAEYVLVSFTSIQFDLNSNRHSLATETDYVRERLAGFGNDLLSLGADGFRIDAAKRE